MNKVTTVSLREMKAKNDKIVMLTGYDYPMAKLLNEAGVDVLLVGDSMGMVKLGYDSTLPVTVEDILYHCKAVRRAGGRALVVADMPFMSYETSADDAIANAGKLLKFGGAEGVKVEGGAEIAPTVAALVNAKVPVMGHIGLTPQAINQLGGYKVQGRDGETARKLLADAQALAAAGAFALVLECLPAGLAADITASVPIPTIGIGAGPHCDGQVLVTDDLLGLFAEFKPKFVKRYANLRPQILQSVKDFSDDVRSGTFPDDDHSYT